MKKITFIIPDNSKLDLNHLMMQSVDFRVEQMTDSKNFKAPRTIHKIPGTTTIATLMEHYSAAAKFNIKDAEKWLKEKGYANGSASSALYGLVKAGYVKKLSPNVFEFNKPFAKGQTAV